MHISSNPILKTLTQAMPFAEVFKHGDLSVELYQPVGEDLQQPHERDEIYLIISGEGVFNHNGTRRPFKAGDLIHVAKHVAHRFETFSPDFATWVIFYTADGEPFFTQGQP